MNREELDAWIQEYGTGYWEDYYCNRLDWILISMKDEWIAVFEKINPNYFRPATQARDMDHAKSYCQMVEPVTVPLQVLAP